MARHPRPVEKFDQPVTPAETGARSDRPSVTGFWSWRKVRAYVSLTHPVPIAIVMIATAAFAAIFAEGLPPFRLAATLLLAMLGGQLAIGALNELVDVELDAASKPWKPIPSGAVSRFGARMIAACGLGMAALFGASLGVAALLLLFVGTGLGLAYDLWLKRTPWSWLPYVLALPLLPIWVRTVVIGFDARLLLLYPLGLGAGAAIHLAQALPDCESDRAAGLRNPVSRLGERRSLMAACALATTAPLAAVSAAAAVPDEVARNGVVLSSATLAIGLIAAVPLLCRHQRSLGVRAAFPCLALATLIVAFGWVLGTR